MTTDDHAQTLAELSLSEKAALCLGANFWHTRDISRLNIPSLLLSDGPHGLRVQKADAGDHLGLGKSEPATCFPTASALGSSWDPELVGRVGDAIAQEAIALGVAVVLGPGINIKRSPLCGRNFEYFSEDPHLSAMLGAAWVRAVQDQGVGASVKHFAVNNQETDRLRVSADVSERAMREIYLPAFEHIVTTTSPWTVMCSYNRINGVHASQDPWLLTDLLRTEWGFEGLVVSDWGAVHDRVASLAAGLDLEMPPNLGRSDVALVEAVTNGALDEGVLDQAVARLLDLIQRAESRRPSQTPEIDLDPHHALARHVAHQCAVLLKNHHELLPLNPSPGGTVAVIGEFARSPRFQGSGSSQVNPTRIDNALEALQAGLAGQARLDFAPGYRLDAPGDVLDDDLIEQAVHVAEQAEVAVVFLGLPGLAESEGFDRTHINLPTDQLHLLARIRQVAQRVVVVLTNGSAVSLTEIEPQTDAILECWLPGQAGGAAIADLLLGDAAPGGRLAETIPVRLEDNSSYLNFPGDSGHVTYGEGVFVGYRGYDRQHLAVAYPFGFGLTYTTFEYSDPHVDITGSPISGDLHVSVSCAVTNTGDRAGKDVVQIYVRDPVATVTRPIRELRGFAAVTLDPGSQTRITIDLDERAFSFWSPTHHCWVTEPGDFIVEIGASSRDIRHTATITLDAVVPSQPLTRLTTLHEWLADPTGADLLWNALRRPDGTIVGALADPHYINIIGSFPMSSLVTFAKTGLSNDILDDMLRQLSSARDRPDAAEMAT